MSLSSELFCRSTELTSGDLFLLKWVVEELQRDLDCRMEVYYTFPGQKYEQQSRALSERKSALLQNSQLWRIFSVSQHPQTLESFQAAICNLTQAAEHPYSQGWHCWRDL